MTKSKSSYRTVQDIHTDNPKKDAVFYATVKELLQTAELIILVEGSSDKRLMDKFYENIYNNVYVQYPPDDGGVSGCAYVKVQNVVCDFHDHRVIGINDADFRNIANENIETIPDKIFLTDAHDIEMMLLQSNEVISSIKAEFGFQIDFNNVTETLKNITMLRFYQFRTKLSIDFNKIKNVSENSNLNLTNLAAKFNHVKIDISEVRKLEELVKANFFLMYNGHDVSKIIATNISANKKESKQRDKNGVSDKTLEAHMRAAYHISAFKKTNLAKCVTKYCKDKNIKLEINS